VAAGHGFHHARTFVAVHRWAGEELRWKLAGQEVGVAQAGRHHPYEYLVVPGLADVDFFDREPPMILPQEHLSGPRRDAGVVAPAQRRFNASF
jgi:hypothetical protein